MELIKKKKKNLQKQKSKIATFNSKKATFLNKKRLGFGFRRFPLRFSSGFFLLFFFNFVHFFDDFLPF